MKVIFYHFCLNFQLGYWFEKYQYFYSLLSQVYSILILYTLHFFPVNTFYVKASLLSLRCKFLLKVLIRVIHMYFLIKLTYTVKAYVKFHTSIIQGCGAEFGARNCINYSNCFYFSVRVENMCKPQNSLCCPCGMLLPCCEEKWLPQLKPHISPRILPFCLTFLQ